MGGYDVSWYGSGKYIGKTGINLDENISNSTSGWRVFAEIC